MFIGTSVGPADLSVRPWYVGSRARGRNEEKVFPRPWVFQGAHEQGEGLER